MILLQQRGGRKGKWITGMRCRCRGGHADKHDRSVRCRTAGCGTSHPEAWKLQQLTTVQAGKAFPAPPFRLNDGAEPVPD